MLAIMIPLDKSRYGTSAFKANKSVQANALRFCYELRSMLQRDDTVQSSPAAQRGFPKYFDRVHQIIAGEAQIGRSPTAKQELADVFAGDNLATAIIGGLARLDFETSKQLLLMLAALLSVSPRLQASLISSIPSILPPLLQGYTDPKLYIVTGQFLREMVQWPALAQCILTVETLSTLATFSKSQIFEVSADAFETLKSLFYSEQPYMPDFLATNYSDLVRIIDGLRDSDNYFLKRQSLALIYKLLDNPRNDLFRQMYAREPDHLKHAMTTMKTESARQVKVEAFLVFACIVEILTQQPADVQQQSQSLKIVRKNMDRLVEYVQLFAQDLEDEKFQAIKRRLLESLRLLN